MYKWENIECFLLSMSYPDFFVLLFHFHKSEYNVNNTLMGLVQISQQRYHNNICHVVLRSWLILGKCLHYFLGYLLLTLNILYCECH